MEKNTSGIITYGDMKTSRVNLIDIINYPASGMPSDYVFKYADNENHRPLINSVGGGDFTLPSTLAELVFKSLRNEL